MQKKGQKDFLLFLHIEKAAGSTLHDIFYNNFFPYYVSSPAPYHIGNDNHETYLNVKQIDAIYNVFPSFKALGGHSVRCFENYEHVGLFPLYFTMLREPVDRYLSHFLYQNEVMGMNRKFSDFLEDEYFSNFMCKKISGSSNFLEAKRVIEDKKICIGIVESFEKSLLLLKSQIELENLSRNFNVYYKPVNTRNQRVRDDVNSRDDLMEKYGAQILNNNKGDIELYKYAKSIFDDINLEPCITSNASLYKSRIGIGKLLRRVFFVHLEKKVGFYFK